MTKHLYNFGISQDDAQTERRALELQRSDRLLCIASAGEVPLNLLALEDLKIDAVDTSSAQLHLSRLKLLAALHLDPGDAASLIGYKPCDEKKRIRMFDHLSKLFSDEEKSFWYGSRHILRKGPVHFGRFEQFISRFNWLGLSILGRKNMMRLFEYDDVELQKQHFDRRLDTKRVKFIFNIAFHPKIYKERGMDARGLTHAGGRNIADFFFSRFRNFCTSTLARENYLLQLTFFNRILFEDALPEYLNATGNHHLRERQKNLNFHFASLSNHLRECPAGYYNKFALSNIGDWMTKQQYSELLQIIGERSQPSAKVLLRYIHYAPTVPPQLQNTILADSVSGEVLESLDRYPFYSLIPMTIKAG